MQIDNFDVGNASGTFRGRNRLAEWFERYLAGGINRGGSSGKGASSRIKRPDQTTPINRNPRNNSDLVEYMWGSERDIEARTLELVLLTQSNKLNKAINFYDKRSKDLKQWLSSEAPLRQVDDEQVINNEKLRGLANSASNFYLNEKLFHKRVAEKLEDLSLSGPELNLFIDEFNKLDNLRDAYDRILQDKDSASRLDYGQPGYIKQLELQKSKDLIEKVLLKNGSVADAELYESVYDDEINAVKNMQLAFDQGKSELAKFWDSIATKAKEMRVEFLERLMDRQSDPDELPGQVEASKQFFENNYSVLMGRVKDSMLAAIEAGQSFENLNNLKASANDNFFLKEEFNLIANDLVDHAVRNRSINQIMTERAKKILDRDRDGIFEDQELVDIMLDSSKASFAYASDATFDFNFDVDNDGEINGSDLNYLRDVMSENNKLFAILDKTKNILDINGDSVVSPDEILESFSRFSASIQEGFAGTQVFDINEDGVVDYNGDFKILQKFLLHDNGLSQSIETNTPATLLLSKMETFKSLISTSIDSANLAMDSFDAIEADPLAKKAVDTQISRMQSLEARNQNIADHLGYQAYLLALYPNRLPEGTPRELAYKDRLNKATELNAEYTENFLAGKSSYKVLRPLSWATWKERLAMTMFVQRKATVKNVAEMDRIADMVMMLDTDMYNYKYGHNTDISTFTSFTTTSNNPDRIKNDLLAEVSAQHYAAVYQLVELKMNNPDKAVHRFFNAEFDKLMQIHEAVESALLARLTEEGLSLNDPEIAQLNEEFFLQQERMKGVITGEISS